MNYYKFNKIAEGHNSAIGDIKKIQEEPFSKVHGIMYYQKRCPYCFSELHFFRCERTDSTDLYKVCPKCNWWRNSILYYSYWDYFHKVAVMTKKDGKEDMAPVIELQKNLLKNWGARKEITAGQCEQLIAEIFKQVLDCEVNYLTSSVYAPDHGIDFVLVNDKKGITYAFQVKRRQTDNPESVRCVREFIGSVAQSKYNKAYFVTTASAYTRNVWSEYNDSVEQLKKKNMDLLLIDGTQLYKILKKYDFFAEENIQLRDLIIRQSSYGDKWTLVEGFPDENCKECILDELFSVLNLREND